MIQNGEPDLLHLVLAVRRRAGVIDDPVAAAFALVAGVADEYHHVIRKFLDPGLVKEKQVAPPGLAAVAADEGDVVIFERARVGEFGEFAVGQIDRKSTRLNSSHLGISYAVFCLKKKNKTTL